MRETIIFQPKNRLNMIVCRLRAPHQRGNEGNYHISTKKSPEYDSLTSTGAASKRGIRKTIIFRLKNGQNMIVCRLRAPYQRGNEENYHISTKKSSGYDSLPLAGCLRGVVPKGSEENYHISTRKWPEYDSLPLVGAV